MIHIVIAAHGDLAESLIRSAKMIAGGANVPALHALSMQEGKSVEDFLADAQAIIAAHPGEGFLLMADLMSASPCNYALSAFRDCNYRLLSGVNLPMLIELMDCRDYMDLDELWEYGFNCGRESINKVFFGSDEE